MIYYGCLLIEYKWEANWKQVEEAEWALKENKNTYNELIVWKYRWSARTKPSQADVCIYFHASVTDWHTLPKCIIFNSHYFS